MPADDIYNVRLNYENPTGVSSSSLYFRETVAQSGAGPSTRIVADSFETQFGQLFNDVLSNDFWLASLEVSLVWQIPVQKYRLDRDGDPGERVGPALPSNNCALIGLHQATFSARSDGRLFLPGIAEGDTDNGVLTDAFLTAAMVPLRDALLVNLVEVSAGTGVWELGVISAKVRDLALPLKDWDGAFAPVNGVSTPTIIATQRARQTKARGATG